MLKKSRPLAIILITLLIMMVGITGCGTSNLKTQSDKTTQQENTDVNENPSSGNTSTPSDTAQATNVTLYFPTSDASGLAPVQRSLKVNNGEIIPAIFDEFRNPPNGLEQVLPSGTKLLSSSVKNGVATINLSKEFKSNFKGGGTGELMTLYSIVNTLTALPNIQSVEFLLNGEKTIAILGEVDTSSPLTRDESLIKK
ncbi:GerMN domain-containing protein [Desulfitobacterium sp.]|uniref:GerMN domain-containing protein n=1 Tax=Desulfitobacterium sp. TaxID=49981 RepID=UPI002B2037ED|nr:GerMN domain-containing protein [Desulfitobacterium sp.]MEA4902491.1 GerMN domain-containing protein [Desulfitobacterium sp.]